VEIHSALMQQKCKQAPDVICSVSTTTLTQTQVIIDDKWPVTKFIDSIYNISACYYLTQYFLK
jgi:hypothetical protein